MASKQAVAGRRTLSRPGSHKACFILGLVNCKCGVRAVISVSRGGDTPHLYIHLCAKCANLPFFEEGEVEAPRRPRRKRTGVKAW
jgi:hypothetical protein